MHKIDCVLKGVHYAGKRIKINKSQWTQGRVDFFLKKVQMKFLVHSVSWSSACAKCSCN
jgi:hypothetical protein